jgi:hypothetical protein
MRDLTKARIDDPGKTAEGGLTGAAVWRDAEPRIAGVRATNGMPTVLNAGTYFENSCRPDLFLSGKMKGRIEDLVQQPKRHLLKRQIGEMPLSHGR